jgi:hypothetical protein
MKSIPLLVLILTSSLHAAGPQRLSEALLLSHRDWAGPEEGLYAFTIDRNLRKWHTTVKQTLGIDKPSLLTKSLLCVGS